MLPADVNESEALYCVVREESPFQALPVSCHRLRVLTQRFHDSRLRLVPELLISYTRQVEQRGLFRLRQLLPLKERHLLLLWHTSPQPLRICNRAANLIFDLQET